MNSYVGSWKGWSKDETQPAYVMYKKMILQWNRWIRELFLTVVSDPHNFFLHACHYACQTSILPFVNSFQAACNLLEFSTLLCVIMLEFSACQTSVLLFVFLLHPRRHNSVHYYAMSLIWAIVCIETPYTFDPSLGVPVYHNSEYLKS